VGQPLLCVKGSRSELTRLCGSEYVNGLPFMQDMDRHASNCKRILFFTRCTVDLDRLNRARGLFDDEERMRALTELEAAVEQGKEFLFACLGSQDMRRCVWHVHWRRPSRCPQHHAARVGKSWPC
jgi:hypothetical protein